MHSTFVIDILNWMGVFAQSEVFFQLYFQSRKTFFMYALCFTRKGASSFVSSASRMEITGRTSLRVISNSSTAFKTVEIMKLLGLKLKLYFS